MWPILSPAHILSLIHIYLIENVFEAAIRHFFPRTNRMDLAKQYGLYGKRAFGQIEALVN